MYYCYCSIVTIVVVIIVGGILSMFSWWGCDLGL